MRKKMFMLFAVVCVVAALVAAPIVTWATPTVVSDIGAMVLSPPVVLVAALALLVVAAVIYRFDLKKFPLAFAVGRRLRYGARDHAPISVWRIFAVTVLAIAGALTTISAFGIVALSPPTVLVALAMLTLICAAADTVCRLWRVRDHAPMSVGHLFTTTTVLVIVVALSTISFVVLAAASSPVALVSILAFLTIAAAVTVTYMLRIRGHAPSLRYEAAHDIKNACSTDTPASARKRTTGLEVRSHAPSLAVSGAFG